MTRIRSSGQFKIESGASLLDFVTEGGGGWDAWDRFLTVEGKPAYHIGNICGTCSFFFERLAGANGSIDASAVRDALNSGLESIDSEAAQALHTFLPSGKYRAFLLDITPRMVTLGTSDDYFSNEQVQTWGLDHFWNLPHDPRIQYYRGDSRRIDASARLFEFVIPMVPFNWLDEDRVTQYMASTSSPTAVAISVLDVKEPAMASEEQKRQGYDQAHWCLAHYLLDGHHKTFASSHVGRPMSLLSFLAIEKGISLPEQVDQLEAILA
ncbi:MAG: hypothetical protein ACLP9L_26400 [Thermoguttaceae bacterium]